MHTQGNTPLPKRKFCTHLAEYNLIHYLVQACSIRAFRSGWNWNLPTSDKAELTSSNFLGAHLMSSLVVASFFHSLWWRVLSPKVVRLVGSWMRLPWRKTSYHKIIVFGHFSTHPCWYCLWIHNCHEKHVIVSLFFSPRYGTCISSIWSLHQAVCIKRVVEVKQVVILVIMIKTLSGEIWYTTCMDKK